MLYDGSETSCGRSSAALCPYEAINIIYALSLFSFQLVDVPEMEYYAVQGQGEVCVQGANVFKGYFKEPEKTREVIDCDGWHHTGDVGKWLPVSEYGTLLILSSEALKED